MSGTNVTVTGDNYGATEELEEPYSYYAGGSSVWWTWTAPIDCVCVLSTAGSSFDTIVGAYSGGSSLSSLSLIDMDDDASSTVSTSLLKFDAFAGTTYTFCVDGYQGVQGIIRLRLTVEPPIIGKPASSWALLTPSGSIVRSSDFAGKVVILDFWATWCGPCKVEIPDFVDLQAHHGSNGLAVIGASTDSTSTAVTRFMQTNVPPLNYTVIMADTPLQTAFGGIEAVPTTFIIDRNNIVRRKYVGTRSKATFTQSIAPLLYGKLQQSRGPGGWSLRWRVDGAPILERTASLATPVWGQWTTSIQPVNGTNVLQIPTGGAGFFRLNYGK